VPKSTGEKVGGFLQKAEDFLQKAEDFLQKTLTKKRLIA
jgi:hypothetical protein